MMLPILLGIALGTWIGIGAAYSLLIVASGKPSLPLRIFCGPIGWLLLL